MNERRFPDAASLFTAWTSREWYPVAPTDREVIRELVLLVARLEEDAAEANARLGVLSERVVELEGKVAA